MNKLIYHIKSALKPRMRNIISILSLALGLALSLVIYANIIYDKSYDNFHNNTDRMYVVRAYYIDDGQEDWGSNIPDIVLPTFLEELPDVEAGTLFRHGGTLYKIDNNDITIPTICVDSSFFDIFNFKVLEGNAREDFKDLSTIYLSQSKASELFGDQDPIGKTVINHVGNERVVRGIFEDIPNNSMIISKFGDIQAMQSMAQFRVRSGWYGGDRSTGVLTLREGVTEAEAEAKIQALVDTKYDPEKAKANNMVIQYRLAPIADTHANSPDVVQRSLIMSILALFLIMVSVLNYALISISALSLRLKEIAVRKCNGASSGSIFRLITLEATIHTVVAMAMAVVLIYVFRGRVEEYFIPINVVFRFENILFILVIVPLIVVLSAAIPGKIFSNISVLTLFMRGVDRRQAWKKVMLCIQFLCAVTLLSLSGMMLTQYSYIFNRDMGYEVDNLIAAQVNIESISDVDKYCDAVASLGCVESVSVSGQKLMSGLSGIGITKGGTMLFSSRHDFVNPTFFENIGVKFTQGAMFDRSSPNAVVNEMFVEKMGWDSAAQAIGKMVNTDYGPLQICGVVKNYETSGWVTNREILPLLLMNIHTLPHEGPITGTMNIRLTETTPENIDSIDSAIRKLAPNNDNLDIESYVARREYLLYDFEVYVVGVNIGGLLILIISALGLYGYISSELQYKHREIALRKVYGASIPSIIMMVYKPILQILSLAILVGVPLSYYIGNLVFGLNFVDIAPMPWWLFIVSSLFVVLFTYGVAATRTYRVATENTIRAIYK